MKFLANQCYRRKLLIADRQLRVGGFAKSERYGRQESKAADTVTPGRPRKRRSSDSRSWLCLD